MDLSHPENDEPLATTIHVRRAREGDLRSVAWLVEKFSPLLLANARYRLGPRLVTIYEPQDVVTDVWMVALPRLGSLSERDARFTPVLVKFLSTTLLFKVNKVIDKHIRRRGHERPFASDPDGSGESEEAQLSADTTGIAGTQQPTAQHACQKIAGHLRKNENE